MNDMLYKELIQNNVQPRNLLPEFLALKDEIIYAMSRGFSRKDIWKRLNATDRFRGCYLTFCNYVTRHIVATSEQSRSITSTGTTAAEVIVAKSLPTKTIPIKPNNKPTTTGFDWSPNYNEDDLF
ncbi:hypothetical protein FJQ87_18495 (plasmid) [Shewanella sp. SNU WT4]|uniref:TraK family protein n=1 Tax=Shewanella sp. SNU WT4 TaxID=2590015 RepID=UPI00112EBEE9|nr:TraK family protein [Shewanella sp. SNU WT4]QDF68695.1 hypothetical protein FJQ87_18495 [Shewanella sp. SNU WT4]